MMWALFIIGSVVWVALWLLQLHYARIVSLAEYPNIGKEAWNTPDILLHGVIGFFLSPFFFLIVMADYFHDREKIDKFHIKKKIEEGSVDLKKVKKTKDPVMLQAAIEHRDSRIRSLERGLDRVNLLSEEREITIDKLTAEKNTLTAEVERLRELTKSVARFDLMDLDEPKK